MFALGVLLGVGLLRHPTRVLLSGRIPSMKGCTISHPVLASQLLFTFGNLLEGQKDISVPELKRTKVVGNQSAYLAYT